MVIRVLYLLLISFSAFAGEIVDPSYLKSLIEEARSQSASTADREKVAQKVLKDLRYDMGEEFAIKDPKELYQEVLKDPAKLKTLVRGKYSDVFTEFSALMGQIQVEKKLAQSNCEDYREIKADVMEGNSSYSACREGIYQHTYITWEAKEPGQIEAKEYAVPNFMYTENLQDLLEVSNHYHSKYGSLSVPPLIDDVETIRKNNSYLSADQVIELHGMMRLQADAYERSVFNAVRNSLSIEYKYNTPTGVSFDPEAKANAAIEKNCKLCDPTMKKLLKTRVKNAISKDISSGELTKRDHAEVAKGLCEQLDKERYPYRYSLTTPGSFLFGKDKAKNIGIDRERVQTLSRVANRGGDGLLILTDGMTDMDGKEPASTKLNCWHYVKDKEKALADNKEVVRQAGLDAQESAEKYLEEINDDFSTSNDYNKVRDNIKLLMRTNPRSVGEALNQNHKMTPGVCNLLQEIKADDEAEAYNSKLLIWGAAIVGGALTLTGVLAPLGGAITLGSVALAAGTVLGITTGVINYNKAMEYKERSELYEAAMFATNNPKLAQISQQEYEKYQSAKIAAMVDFGLSAVDVLAYTVKAVRAGKSIDDAIDGLKTGNVERTTASTEIKVATTETKVTEETSNMLPEVTITANRPKTTIKGEAKNVPKANQPKVKTTGTATPESSGKRLNYDELSEKDAAYYRYLEKEKVTKRIPKVERYKTGEQRLAELKGTSERDIKYMIENKELVEDFGGGEAKIFINPHNPDEAVKIWKQNRLDDFELSVKGMQVTEQRVAQNPVLKRHIVVSQIKEKGKNYIIKEFNQNSTELKHFVNDPGVRKVIDELSIELGRKTDSFNQRLLQSMVKNPPSGNLHWDPVQKKIVVIDALGF